LKNNDYICRRIGGSNYLLTRGSTVLFLLLFTVYKFNDGTMSGKKRVFLNEGDRYGRLTIIKEGKHIGTRRWYLCKCDCGVIKEIPLRSIQTGASSSCGCYHSEIMIKHGLTHSSLYNIRRSMIKRCYLINHKSYDYYGGRGIDVCKEWITDFMAFYNWAIKSGYKKGLSIDRIDNNKGYYPENCRWADLITQANNRRDNVWYNYNGGRMTLAQICRSLGIIDKRRLVKQRMIKYGWNLLDALNAYL